MRTVKIAAILAAAIALAAGSAGAQLRIDVTGAYTMPMGDFGDVSTPGFGIGAEVFATLPMLPLELGGRVAYNRFGAEDDFDDGSTSIIEILPSARYVFGPPLSPVKIFGQLGVGLYNWNSEFEFKNIDQTMEDDGNDFGVALGLGIRGKVGPIPGLIVLPMYHIIFTEDENTNYLALNVGVAF